MKTFTEVIGFCTKCRKNHRYDEPCVETMVRYSGSSLTKSDVIDNIIKQLEKLKEELK